MAEVIGTLTGLLGACDIILRATTATVEYIKDIKDAPEDIQTPRLEIESLEAVVRAAHSFLGSSKASCHPLTNSSPIAATISHCSCFIIDLQKTFHKDSSRPRILWALNSKQRYRVVLQDIGRYIATFHVALSLDGWEMFFQSSQKAKESLEKVHNDLQKVIGGLRTLERQGRELDKLRTAIGSALEFCVDIPRVVHEPERLHRIEERMELIVLELEDEKNAKEEQELLDFLSKTDLRQKHIDVTEIRHENTGSWILKESQFKQWLKPSDITAPNATLFCHGIPGCGKTILFSTIAGYLLEKQRSLDMVVAAILSKP